MSEASNKVKYMSGDVLTANMKWRRVLAAATAAAAAAAVKV